MDPTNKPVQLTLNNGKTHKLLFDLNTFYEFEEKADKTLPAFLLEMERAFAPLLAAKKSAEDAVKKAAEDSTTDSVDVSVVEIRDSDIAAALGKISVKDIRALIWASMHDYDNKGEPVWPYTIGKLGSLIDHKNLNSVITQLVAGVSGSLPEKNTSEKDRPTLDPTLAEKNGGDGSGSLGETILASIPKRSDN